MKNPTSTLRLAPLALALGLVLGTTATAFAKDHDRPTSRRTVVHGVISNVATTDGGLLLTLDRGERDDDPADDVAIQLSAATRISPPGVLPAVDVRAHAIATAPAEEGGAYAALVLVLGGRPQPPNRPLQACGTISALPASGRVGQWTVQVPDVADYTFGVTAQTRITPSRIDPAVGMRTCFLARAAGSGWIAQNIELKPNHDGDDDGDDEDEDGDRARVELVGTVTDLPADRAVTWTLTISLTMHAANPTADVKVTPDTEIDGDLAAGARVAVRASRSTDAAGNAVLTALKIKVLGAPSTPGGGHAHEPVRVEGVVTAISADHATWTIEHDGTAVEVTIGADTHIVGLAAGASALDRAVEGMAMRQADGSLLAKLLRIKRH